MSGLPIPFDLGRSIELLNDAVHFAMNSKSADTRISRSEDALQRIIPAIRQVNPYAVHNLDGIQAYFESVVRTAETVEFVQKACAAKQAVARDRNWEEARRVARMRGATDRDFVVVDARDPRTKLVLTLATLAGNLPVVLEAQVITPRVVHRGENDRSHLDDLLKRDHSLSGGIVWGLDGYIIELQARAIEVFDEPIPWKHAVKISGMARGAVTEVLDRLTGAFSKFGIPNPEVQIIVNLAPADLVKEGTWLDLPLAVILLQAAGYLPDLDDDKEKDFVLMGEVGLHGEIRRVPGSLSLAFVAKPGQALIVPSGNEKECALILAKPGHEGCRVYAVSALNEVVEFFRGKRRLENSLKQQISFENAVERAVDFGRIKGQKKAKVAALIAAAGGHNLLLIGPPGEGKSLIASAIPGILPRLSNDEKVELTRIYSACGMLEKDGMAVTRRPMRSVHHTSSTQSVIGGGSKVARPGEITLSHLGILFLDEIAEFSRGTLEAMRQPMESGTVSISRVGGTLTFPARFTLVAAMNPCPCGYFGSERCKCRDADIKKYQKKISGPILDRIDLQVELERLSTEERFAESTDELSPRMRNQVEQARKRQLSRFTGKSISYNAAIPGGHVREHCNFSPDGFEFFRQTIDGNDLSTRSMDRLAKVSRTIADLADSEFVEARHVDSASGFVIGGLLREAFQS